MQPSLILITIKQMNTEALIIMIGSQLIIAGFTVYFFYKVFTTPTKKEEE